MDKWSNKIRYNKERIFKSIDVTFIVNKMRKNILRWFGYEMKRKEINAIIVV
jgi:hypothetical protein